MAGGGARTQKNKAHKTRLASKSARHAHKTDKAGVGLPSRCTPSTAAARPLRIQRSKDVRDKKRAQVLAEKRSSHGFGSPPAILALVALSSQVRLEVLKRRLLAASSKEEGIAVTCLDDMDDAVDSSQLNLKTVAVPRFKIRLTVMTAPFNDIQALLDVTKVADVVAFVTMATAEGHGEFVDSGGKRCLSVLRVQGSASSVGFVLGLDSMPGKKRAEIKREAVAALQGELLEDSKVFTVDSDADCQQVLRHLSEKRLLPPIWRSQRPYLLAQQVDFAANPSAPGKGTLRLCGYVRGRGLSVNQLVHVPRAGDFQLEKIDILDDPNPLRANQRVSEETETNPMLMDKPSMCLTPSSELQEPLIFANVPDTLAGEQTWPTETELGMAHKETAQRLQKKRVPKGTSNYQASWIVDEGSDLEPENDASVRDENMAEAEDMEVGVMKEARDADKRSHVAAADGSEDLVYDDDEEQSEIMDDEELTAAPMDGEFQQLKDARPVDDEFPDHVDTPTNIPARLRFAKYRGLKSFRTSIWDTKESLPPDYARVFAFQNLTRTRKYILDLAQQADEGHKAGCVGVGTYVRLHVSNVPSGPAGHLLDSSDRRLVVACGLLKHESKMSVLHFSVKKSDDYASKVRSKEEFFFHAGFRQFSARPIFSTDSINADKHKFERSLQSGQFLIATVFAPVAFSPVPVVMLKDDGEGICNLVASGSLKTVDPDRIILKKIVLSGYPHRVLKRKAVVRFMFHNPEDVRWFKPVDLFSKYGRRGRIQEPVGTHGAMKCIFDGVIQQRDSVCLSLYKRVYPKWPHE